MISIAVALVCMTAVSFGQENQPAKTRILVVGLDTLEFSSNVFYIDELAYYNGVPVERVIELYNRTLVETIKKSAEMDYEFVVADSADKVALHLATEFVELEKEDGEEFVGIAPILNAGFGLIDLFKKYQADYVLTVNAYQIYSENPPQYISYNTRTEHIVHFDVFDAHLNSVFAGKFSMTSFAVEAVFNENGYEDFANEALTRIRAYELSQETGKSPQEAYTTLREAKYSQAMSMGLQVAFDGPYGLVGGYLAQMLGPDLEVNGGLGYGFSGFKIGAGGRYYLDVFGLRFKPFIGFNYSYTAGNRFEIGGETDEFGNQLDPNDVSRFRIFPDHALHFKGGMSYRFEHRAIMLEAGYSFPFKGERPELLSGNDSRSRQNFANAMAPGGLEITFSYQIYLFD